MDRPDGSTIYRYNGALQERLMLTVGADGKPHIGCGAVDHTHGAAQVRESSDDR